MRFRRLSYLTLCLFISSTASALTITTLNLEWFGRGGEKEGLPSDEYRAPTIRELIATHLSQTDVFVFEEVIDVPSLLTILPGWDCRSYDIENLEHQHVAACAFPGVITADSVIESVRVTPGLRPAFRVDLKFSNHQDLSVIGLHLKAGPDYSDTRVTQIQNLLASLEPNTPIMILGDFNTFNKDKTGKLQDDSELMNNYFKAQNFEQAGGDKMTYLGFDRHSFDRIWERNLDVISHQVFGPCQDRALPRSRFTLESFYTRFVSDHCPVSVEIK